MHLKLVITLCFMIPRVNVVAPPPGPPPPVATNKFMNLRCSCSSMAAVARSISQQTLDNYLMYFSQLTASCSTFCSISCNLAMPEAI